MFFFVGRGFPDWCSLPQIQKDEDEIDDTNNRPDWCPLEEVPETHDKHTETHACDLISRQAAIDLIKKCIPPEECAKQSLIMGMEQLPSAQIINEVSSLNIEFTEKEKNVLQMLLTICKTIIEAQNGYMEIDYESFDRGDLYYLSEKLGVEEY